MNVVLPTRHYGALWIFAIIALYAGSVAAQEPPPTDPPTDPPADPKPEVDPVARAFELNERGFAAFDEGRYDDAARAFAEAWTYSHDETLRKNESLAWFRAGECDPAVEAGNKFLLVEGISDADRTDIHSVIANCKAEFAQRAIDAGDLDLAETMLNEADTLQPDQVARDRVAAARVDLAAARRAAEEAKPPPEPTIRTVYVPEPAAAEAPILGYSLIGAGGAVIVGTLVYHLVALGWQSKFFQMRDGDIGGDQAEFDSLRKRVHLARVLVPVGYTIGALGAGAGVTLAFIVDSPSRSEAADARRPRIGFQIAGHFQ